MAAQPDGRQGAVPQRIPVCRLRQILHGRNGIPRDPGTDLGILGGDTISEAYAINSAGQVVGGSWPKFGDSHLNAVGRAFFVDAGNSPMVDLNTRIPSGSGWVLLHAHGINDSGQIAGVGLKGGQPHAFLLTPK